MKELQSINLRSPKVDKPFLDHMDMYVCICIVCAAFITDLLYRQGWIKFFGEFIRDACSVVIVIAMLTYVLFTVTNWIVGYCYYRAKRKAQDNKVKDLNKNSIK